MYNISAKSFFIGQNVIEIEECSSTNDYLKELCSISNAIEGTVVLTANQTNGKGQFENKWLTEPYKNMTFSLFLKPSFIKLENRFEISIITSLAIVDFLKKYIPEDVFIKWPNDIYVGKKKICGMLIENTIVGNSISGSIVGIGININQEDFGALNTKATSLKNCTQTTFSIENLYGEFFECFEKRYFQAINKKPLKQEYLSSLLNYQEKANYIINNELVEGIIVGVDTEGKLALQLDNQLSYFNLKELVFVM